LKARLKLALSKGCSVARFFGEDVEDETFQWEGFLSVLNQFTQDYKKIEYSINKEKAEAELAKKRKEQEKNKTKEKVVVKSEVEEADEVSNLLKKFFLAGQKNPKKGKASDDDWDD